MQWPPLYGVLQVEMEGGQLQSARDVWVEVAVPEEAGEPTARIAEEKVRSWTSQTAEVWLQQWVATKVVPRRKGARTVCGHGCCVRFHETGSSWVQAHQAGHTSVAEQLAQACHATRKRELIISATSPTDDSPQCFPLLQEILRVSHLSAGTTYRWWDAYFDRWSEVFIAKSSTATEADNQLKQQQTQEAMWVAA